MGFKGKKQSLSDHELIFKMYQLQISFQSSNSIVHDLCQIVQAYLHTLINNSNIYPILNSLGPTIQYCEMNVALTYKGSLVIGLFISRLLFFFCYIDVQNIILVFTKYAVPYSYPNYSIKLAQLIRNLAYF